MTAHMHARKTTTIIYELSSVYELSNTQTSLLTPA